VLFFSVAAMVVQQSVIVVVPFSALVDDLVVRGLGHGLSTEEWIDETSCHDIPQLVIVSADRAVHTEFLHWAKGLELYNQLAHMFFDEGHVAFTDRSYRTRLRELWRLRYLNCPFTVLTATLMVKLEGKLREQLLIPDAILFRRNTVRATIQYKVVDSQDEMPSKRAIAFVRQLPTFPKGKRGVIYVRSYMTGEAISKELDCPFYKATAEQKSQLLDTWSQGSGGWIVATGALGTGINIQGIIYVVHVDRPYGLTSFAQQSGRGGRGGEISQSIIVIRVKSTKPYKRSGIVSEYSTEQIDEEAMTEFVQSKECRRNVLGRYFDGEVLGDCREMDWVQCDICSAQSHQDRVLQIIDQTDANTDSEVNGSEMIAVGSYKREEAEERMFQVMKGLKEQCIYCMFTHGEEGSKISEDEAHSYEDYNCFHAEMEQCTFQHFRKWRKSIRLESGLDCFTCGLSQQICRATEDGTKCEYPNMVFQGFFILHQQGKLEEVAKIEGFQGLYEGDIWDWMREIDEGIGLERESNWMRTWRQVCEVYNQMQEKKSRTE